METFNKLVELTKTIGIMLTVRYVTERNTWALLLHIDKTTAIGSEGDTFEEVCEDALKQYNSKTKSSLK